MLINFLDNFPANMPFLHTTHKHFITNMLNQIIFKWAFHLNDFHLGQKFHSIADKKGNVLYLCKKENIFSQQSNIRNKGHSKT